MFLISVIEVFVRRIMIINKMVLIFVVCWFNFIVIFLFKFKIVSCWESKRVMNIFLIIKGIMIWSCF